MNNTITELISLSEAASFAKTDSASNALLKKRIDEIFTESCAVVESNALDINVENVRLFKTEDNKYLIEMEELERFSSCAKMNNIAALEEIADYYKDEQITAENLYVVADKDAYNAIASNYGACKEMTEYLDTISEMKQLGVKFMIKK